METVYKDIQVSQVAHHLGIPKITVSTILDAYIGYLKGKLENGETIKFLNVCYLKVDGQDEKNHETLAYISNELGKELGFSQIVVFRVLTSFEEYLILDLRKFYSYSIRGLVHIHLEKNHNQEYKVRARKSTVYKGKDIHITTLGSFKRKAEIL